MNQKYGTDGNEIIRFRLFAYFSLNTSLVLIVLGKISHEHYTGIYPEENKKQQIFKLYIN